LVEYHGLMYSCEKRKGQIKSREWQKNDEKTKLQKGVFERGTKNFQGVKNWERALEGRGKGTKRKKERKKARNPKKRAKC